MTELQRTDPMWRARSKSSAGTPVLAAMVAFVVVLVIAVSANNSAPAVTLGAVLGLTAAILVWAIFHAANDEARLGALHPAVLLFSYLLLVYIGRPLYIMTSGFFGTHQMSTYPIGYSMSEVTSTSVIVLGLVAVFTFGFWVAPTSGFASLYNNVTARPRRYGSRLFFLFIVSLGAASYVLVKATVDFGDLRIALSQRAELFAGEQYLIFVLQVYKFGFLFWLADRLGQSDKIPMRLIFAAVALWLPSFAFDFLTGSRADLIYRNLIPVAAVLAVSSLAKPSRLRFALVPVLIAVIAFVGIRVGVRDAAVIETGGSISQSSVLDTLTALPEFILSGDEAAIFDALTIILMQSEQTLPKRGSEGLLAVLLAPVPSGFLDEKPPRSTTYFTELVRPELAAKGGNIAISSAGDLFLIGGVAVAIVGYGCIGLLAGMTVRGASTAALREGSRKQVVVLGFAAVAGLMSVIRADLTEVALLLFRLGIPILVLVVLSASGPRVDRFTRSSPGRQGP